MARTIIERWTVRRTRLCLAHGRRTTELSFWHTCTKRRRLALPGSNCDTTVWHECKFFVLVVYSVACKKCDAWIKKKCKKFLKTNLHFLIGHFALANNRLCAVHANIFESQIDKIVATFQHCINERLACVWLNFFGQHTENFYRHMCIFGRIVQLLLWQFVGLPIWAAYTPIFIQFHIQMVQSQFRQAMWLATCHDGQIAKVQRAAHAHAIVFGYETSIFERCHTDFYYRIIFQQFLLGNTRALNVYKWIVQNVGTHSQISWNMFQLAQFEQCA